MKENVFVCRNCNKVKKHYAKKYCKTCYDLKIWRPKNWEKHLSHQRTYNKRERLRDSVCSKCGSKENLVYHHVDYNNDIGYTLCMKCHYLVHNLKIKKKK
jgi:DNA-directed RNA polymerase subunit M/transcription elongation factor TFIIS